MNRSAMDLWVGIFVAASMVALLFLALKVSSFSGIRAEDTYRIAARFDNIGALKIKAPVRSAGVLVGRVASIRFNDETYEAEVEIRVDNRYRFPKDTFASIYTAGLLGDQYVGLEPGGDEQYLADGDQIVKTQSAVVLEKLIGQFLFSKAAESQADSASPPR
ncbi:MAG: outer membrane lipid asymmetry maintenance protein MlaD [Zoogloeaceae bacterium]|jgi:phospholipid/cholesterol/gamma-HCH transport system substrate-binding protein|nr:outer membrane lipid asymmetry maintenance protein MlaD [Zoogloeaceae bacterium]